MPANSSATSRHDLPHVTPPSTFPRVKPAELRRYLPLMAVAASQGHQLGAELNLLAPSSPGQPFQPTAAVDLSTAALCTRTQTTISRVAALFESYLLNEARARTEMATLPQTRLV